MPAEPRRPPRVALFVTCLVDLIRPSVGFAAVKLLEEAGCTVEVPTQTCCGQPAYNSGDRATTRAIAEQVVAAFEPRVTYHDSCSGLRELGVKAQPRRLLASVKGLSLTEMHDSDVCCGFGGTFCVKYPDISNTIVTKKAEHIAATGAGTLLAGDLGCLMNMAGKLQRLGKPVKARHVAEVLAGLDAPAIGEG